MPKREYDPLSMIPRAATVRQRLERIQEQARKLRILLRTAEQIEQEQAEQEQAKNAGYRQGVTNA
jgi:hypothetical protein